jgi:pimeloyl-ACP methyl ester carboxylesterase
MPHFERDGVKLYYEDHGEGPAVLLTHGFGATAEMWAGQVEAFRDRYRIVAWDMRGHGRTDYPEDQGLYSEDHTVADIAALLDHCGIERAVVGGLSLGGYAALGFHIEYPERTRALIICDTGPGFRKDESRQAWNERTIRRAEKYEIEGLSTQRASAEVDASSHRSAEGLVRAARGMLTQRDSAVIDSLPGIEVPSIVIVGANDTNFLVSSDYMAAKIPGAVKVVIPDAGHGANIDQPEAFNQAMGSFLDGLPN